VSASLPEELHRLRGTRSTRAAVRESAIAGGRPNMPKDLTPNQRAAWKEIVKYLKPRRTLTKADGPALRLYAETSARHRALLLELDTHGEVIEQDVLDSSGVAHTKRILNPASRQASTVSKDLRAMLRELSATPASRETARPTAPPPPKKNAIIPGSVEDLLQQRTALALAESENETETETEPEEEPDNDLLNDI
jgi:P27 family predicted phage terminase small subunit